MKKKPFLLLEVLIAFLLVVICIVPLVRQPLMLYRAEMEHLEVMELERLADWTFTEVKEMLLKNEVPWEKIPRKDARTSEFPLTDVILQIPGCPPKTIHRGFYLQGKAEKIGNQNQIYRQIWIQVSLNKHIYTFRMPVEKRME